MSSALSPSSNSTKDLWTLIREEVSKPKSKSRSDLSATNDTSIPFEIGANASLYSGVESNLILMGPRGSGKTTLINRFLEKNEEVHPTIGLEYTYARRSRSNSTAKDLCHVWEIAGGPNLLPLLDIALTAKNIHTTTVLITVNLSDPSALIPTLETYIPHLEARVQTVLSDLASRGSQRPITLTHQKQRAYEGCTDPGLTLIPVSWALLCTFDDVCERTFPRHHCDVVRQWARYVAHVFGGHTVFLDAVGKGKPWMHHFGFRAPRPTTGTCFLAGTDRVAHLFPGASVRTYVSLKQAVHPVLMTIQAEKPAVGGSLPAQLEMELKTKYAERRIDVECIY